MKQFTRTRRISMCSCDEIIWILSWKIKVGTKTCSTWYQYIYTQARVLHKKSKTKNIKPQENSWIVTWLCVALHAARVRRDSVLPFLQDGHVQHCTVVRLQLHSHLQLGAANDRFVQLIYTLALACNCLCALEKICWDYFTREEKTNKHYFTGDDQCGQSLTKSLRNVLCQKWQLQKDEVKEIFYNYMNEWFFSRKKKNWMKRASIFPLVLRLHNLYDKC